MERDDARADVGIGARILGGQSGGHRIHLRLRRIERDLPPDPRDHVPPAAAANAGLVLGDRLGHVDVALAAAALETELEVRREHADHGVRLPVQGQRPPEDAGVAAEAALPEPVRQDDDPAARTVLFRQERPAVRGPDPERLEETLGDQRRVEHLGLAVPGEIERVRLDRRHLLEAGRLLAPVQEVGRRRFGRHVAVVRIGLPQRHEAVGFRKRRRLEQHRVDHREDRRGRADRQRQGEDRGRREPRLPAQEPDAETGVLEEVLQCRTEAEPPLRRLRPPVCRAPRVGHRMLPSVTVLP